ncbi:hypothetical protein ACFOLJ_00145 [Rugamonas sp. CCM 8940]
MLAAAAVACAATTTALAVTGGVGASSWCSVAARGRVIQRAMVWPSACW